MHPFTFTLPFVAGTFPSPSYDTGGTVQSEEGAMRLLIAEDDPDLALLLGQTARVLWPAVQIAAAHDGVGALRSFATHRPDMLILDVALPPHNGPAVCRQIRHADAAVLILVLAARDTTLDELRALEMGADAYLPASCDADRLPARLRALARRVPLAPAPPPPALVMDREERVAHLEGRPIPLAPLEYALLALLAERAGNVVPHAALLTRGWGSARAADRRSLKVSINRLRRKLGDDMAHPRSIETRHRGGYRLVAR
jgi:DNA-binding response OmpR family regulator